MQTKGENFRSHCDRDASAKLLQAQDDCGDLCKINSNVAMIINVPVNPSAQAVGTGWGIAGGDRI